MLKNIFDEKFILPLNTILPDDLTYEYLYNLLSNEITLISYFLGINTKIIQDSILLDDFKANVGLLSIEPYTLLRYVRPITNIFIPRSKELHNVINQFKIKKKKNKRNMEKHIQKFFECFYGVYQKSLTDEKEDSRRADLETRNNVYEIKNITIQGFVDKSIGQVLDYTYILKNTKQPVIITFGKVEEENAERLSWIAERSNIRLIQAEPIIHKYSNGSIIELFIPLFISILDKIDVSEKNIKIDEVSSYNQHNLIELSRYNYKNYVDLLKRLNENYVIESLNKILRYGVDPLYYFHNRIEIRKIYEFKFEFSNKPRKTYLETLIEDDLSDGLDYDHKIITYSNLSDPIAFSERLDKFEERLTFFYGLYNIGIIDNDDIESHRLNYVSLLKRYYTLKYKSSDRILLEFFINQGFLTLSDIFAFCLRIHCQKYVDRNMMDYSQIRQSDILKKTLESLKSEQKVKKR